MKLLGKCLLLLVILYSSFFIFNSPVKADYQELGKLKFFGPMAKYEGAQYSPFILHQPGWGGWVMYYCKNSPYAQTVTGNPPNTDRIWRTQQWQTGLTTPWTGDQMVLEGTWSTDDALSCAMGIVIDSTGTWHMYYVTALNAPNVPIYLYHATASAPGLVWQKQGKVLFEGATQPLFSPYVFMDTPTPILIGSDLWLYYVGDMGKLYRSKATTADRHTFSKPEQLNTPIWMPHARVTYHKGLYYMVYATTASRTCCDPPTQIWLSVSPDGINFPFGKKIMESNGSDWDGKYMWTPYLFFDDQDVGRVYYAGNAITVPNGSDFWGYESSIGARWFSGVVPTSQLTCNYPWEAVPPPTHTLNAQGNPVEINLGFSQQFGGIGVKFELINKNNPTPVDILEARSGAGAAWQSTDMVTYPNGVGYLANQTTGNSVGFQSGYSNELALENFNGVQTLYSLNWAPNPTDVYNGKGTSPCPGTWYDTALVHDEGRPTVAVKTVPVSSGSIIDITNTYSHRKIGTETWKTYVPVNGFYLSRKVARARDLRVYLVGKDGWKEGPIWPFDDFSLDPTHGYTPTSSKTFWQINPDLKRALFVWNINGLDEGILFPEIPFGATIRLDKLSYCTDPNNDDCGSMDFGFTSGILQNVTFTDGQIRNHNYKYLIGTVPQLEEYIGETLVPPPVIGPPPIITQYDVNADFKVDILDLARIVNAWTQPEILNYHGREDVTGNGILDIEDLNAFLLQYTHL